MATTEVWLDFDQVRHGIKNNTVDRLKQILAGLNDECGTHFSKSGKKQEIIDKIVAALDGWRANNNEERWTKAKAVVYQVRNTGIYTPSNRTIGAGLVASASHAFDPPQTSSYSSSISGTTSIGHYDPYAPPRRPSGISAPAASSSNGPKAPPIRFKESPFFVVDQTVTSVVECPESTSATDRRQQSLAYTLNNDQVTKMKTAGSKYQLRLFCTSSIFYAGIGTFRTNPVPCPIEFPPTCEVRVNNAQITANLKGLKKKPGTAPPPDLGKYSRLTGANRVEMVYVNSQQPVQSKSQKYYMIVMLVEITTIDVLVTKLKNQSYRSAHEIQQKMLQAMSEDDDIIAGPQKMSLKCPLTFVRITTPCRSYKCVHPQCFDATSWFTMMEQTTTWLCPVCERVLDHKDLIIDGYFDEILQQTPESIEDVMVEADGQWHTSDNKYGSAQWIAAHPAKSLSPAKPEPSQSPARPQAPPPTNGVGQANGKGKAPDVEIFILDSDEDEDEGRVKRELSPSYASSTRESFDGTLPQTQTQSQGNVIDLTLDDSDDDVPASNTYGKRKATEADLDTVTLPETLWKKGRIDDPSRILPAPRPSGGIGPRSSLSSLPPSPPAPRFSTSFPGNTLPPPAFSGFNNGRTASGSVQLPPLSSTFVSRPSAHHSGWS